ncbi:MAG: cell division protein ZapB [Nitrospirales bacterium]
MALDRMEALETRIRKLVEMVQELKRANLALEAEIKHARARLSEREAENRRWEEERAHIRTRIEKVLGQLDILDGVAEPKEVALD